MLELFKMKIPETSNILKFLKHSSSSDLFVVAGTSLKPQVYRSVFQNEVTQMLKLHKTLSPET